MPLDFNTLTAKQKKVYAAIESFIKSKGIPPTVREIGELIGEKTPGAVQGILNRLEQKGVIKREVGMARSIKLVQENSQYVEPVFIPELKRVNKRNVSSLLNVYNIVNYQPLPPNFVSSGKDCFILNCPDNSLVDSGIRYEDTLIIDKSPDLNDDDIVLVLYDNHTLLRRYYLNRHDGTVTLKADSNLLDRETFKPDEIVIVGKVAGKYTKF